MSSHQPKYLTKSRFKLAVECPTKLFYTSKRDYANTMNEDEFMAMLADGGFQVGELTKLMYPGGVEIKAKAVDGAVVETAQHMAEDEVVLFEPAIVFDDFLVRVDVLIKRGNFIRVIEVKAKSYDGDPSCMQGKRNAINSEYRSYLEDVAFQKYVVTRAFPQATVTAHLLMPDKTKTASVNGLNQWFKVKREGRNTEVTVDERAYQPGLAESVLTCVDVDFLVDEVFKQGLSFPGGQAPLQQAASDWAKAYSAGQRIPPVLGKNCGSCEFHAPLGSDMKSGFHECWRSVLTWQDADFTQGTVLDLWNSRRKDSFMAQGKYKLSQLSATDFDAQEIDGGELSNAQRQLLQVKGLPDEYRKRGYYLDDAGLAAAMRGWTWPLHFIDFETASVALPFHEGRRPYEQVAFQFSHHVLHADGRLEHAHQFLCDELGVFPNVAFVRALREALIGDQGTVFRWSHHENTILDKIREQLMHDQTPPPDAQDLLDFIDQITRNGSRAMVDLADLAKKHYYHPSTKGSVSIKKVLPAVMQSSDFLRDRYSQPIYGNADLPSLNFREQIWWQCDEQGQVLDPYQILVREGAVDADVERAEAINQGGAASYAYLRLQFEELPDETRQALRYALLRYCELDTLAMAFVVQAWLSDCR